MKLTRTLPALLALSLLTGCDVNALLPKLTNPTNPGSGTNTNPVSSIQELTQAELKSVAAFTSGLTAAANQGGTAAGTINALKSVAAFTTQSFQTASITYPDGLTWVDHPIDGKFVGQKAEYKNAGANADSTSDDEAAYYLKGDFTPQTNFAASGSAMLKTVGTPSPTNPGAFEGTVQLDLTVTQAPEAAKDLEGAKIDLTVNNGKLATLLKGSFDITPASASSPVKGAFGVELFNKAWWVEVPSKDADGNATFVKLNFYGDGSGQGKVYGAKNDGTKDMPDYDVKHAEFTWSQDGKGKVVLPNGKEDSIQMPF